MADGTIARLQSAADTSRGNRLTIFNRWNSQTAPLGSQSARSWAPLLACWRWRSSDTMPRRAFPSTSERAEPSQTAQAPAVEPDKTGAIAPANLAALEATGPLRGVPDVLDTATLWVEGKIVHLYGVEWVRGAGNPDEFTRYLRGRVVVCTPVASANAHRCILDGRDLSLVVLVNGGGRTTADAPTQFRAAEELAKSAKLGVWSK